MYVQKGTTDMQPIYNVETSQTWTLHCCRWGYVTMTTAVYSLNSITLASALKSTAEWAIAMLPYP